MWTFPKRLVRSLEWDPSQFHRDCFQLSESLLPRDKRQTCFYFILCLNCTLLNSVWPAGFGRASRSGWICARSLPSSQTGSEPSPLAALCQEQILHALPSADAPYERRTWLHAHVLLLHPHRAWEKSFAEPMFRNRSVSFWISTKFLTSHL